MGDRRTIENGDIMCKFYGKGLDLQSRNLRVYRDLGWKHVADAPTVPASREDFWENPVF